MAVAPHIARLRQKVGNDLLLLPSVAVLPIDARGRVLLVKHREFGAFGTLGGAVDEDEAPVDAAIRETHEEIGVDVQITGLIGAVGGPEFRLTYSNGDQTAYVISVYEARLPETDSLHPDGFEVSHTGWFRRDQLTNNDVSPFTVATFSALGWITTPTTPSRH